MNIMAKTLVFGVAGFVAATAGWYVKVFTSIGNQSEFYAVELKPDSTSDKLEVNKDNQCKKKPHKGCLLFEEDKVGLIKFYLPGSKFKVQKCPKAKVVITRVELTTTVDTNFPDGDKGHFGVDLADWIKKDAFPGVNKVSGVVYDAAVGDARTQAWLVNMNSHDAADGEYEFWYKVTATDCDDPTRQWFTDPRGDNTGTKQ